MTSQLNVDTIVDKAGSGGTNVKVANNAVAVAEGGSATTVVVQGLCKAWAAVSMATPSVQDSFNHSSYTDNGQGQGASNLTNSMRADTFTDGVLSGANVNGRIVGYDGIQSRSGTGAYAFRSYAVDTNVEDQRMKVSLHGDLA